MFNFLFKTLLYNLHLRSSRSITNSTIELAAKISRGGRPLIVIHESSLDERRAQ